MSNGGLLPRHDAQRPGICAVGKKEFPELACRNFYFNYVKLLHPGRIANVDGRCSSTGITKMQPLLLFGKCEVSGCFRMNRRRVKDWNTAISRID